MDISSLLQEAPSNDRTRRKQQQQHQQPPREQGKAVDVDNAGQSVHSGQYGHSRGSQTSLEYVQSSVGQAHPAHVPHSQQQMNAHPPPSSRPASSNYYPSHPDPQRLPINPPPEYVDVQTNYGSIRMKKEFISAQTPQQQQPEQQQQQQQQQQSQPPQPSPSLSFSQAYDFQHQQNLAVLQQNRNHPSQNQAHSSVPFNSRRPPAEEPSWKDDDPREPSQKSVINSFSIPHVVAPIPVVARPASPPHSTPLAPPPRTPSPRLDPVHLGSFVYPNLPFPVHPGSLPYNRRTSLTILVPASLLPTSLKDQRSKQIWGGIPHHDERKIYTDDSDIVFAALHSGIISWDESFATSGRDLEVSLRLYPASETGRYYGGEGAEGLKSASWGNAHEGCAFTIQAAIWVSPKTSYSYSRQTRKARMAEYAQRRADIMGIPLKSRYESDESPNEAAATLQSIPLTADIGPAEVKMAALRIVGGWKSTIGFKYDPLLMSSMLSGFGSLSEGSPPKRRRLEKNSSDNNSDLLHEVNTEIIVEGSGKPNERLVLVSKKSTESSDKMEVDERGKRKLEQDQRIFDVYKETRDGLVDETKANMDVEDADKVANKAKVRFAEEPTKTKSKWTRELIRADVESSTIKFETDSIVLGDLSFPAATWRWRTIDKSARQRRLSRKKTKGKKTPGKTQSSASDAVDLATKEANTASSIAEAAPPNSSLAEVEQPSDVSAAAATKEKSPSEEGEIIED